MDAPPLPSLFCLDPAAAQNGAPQDVETYELTWDGFDAFVLYITEKVKKEPTGYAFYVSFCCARDESLQRRVTVKFKWDLKGETFPLDLREPFATTAPPSCRGTYFDVIHSIKTNS